MLHLSLNTVHRPGLTRQPIQTQGCQRVLHIIIQTGEAALLPTAMKAVLFITVLVMPIQILTALAAGHLSTVRLREVQAGQ